ncbi:MAG TPA: choice-of-anchor tandem repeat GloVer-containing protein [Candidatus Acidoferrales bacterium]|nr:choice-of-anchor tandem repeat GloVer-containing protein [Candidatus Acidoferrales bacterium]
MRTLALSALTIGLAAALLAGCVARNNMPPMGAPATSGQTLRTMTSSFQVLHRFGRHDKTRGGASPAGPLLDVNGTLYGTTSNGGLGGYGGNGLVYSITTTGATKVLYLFGGYTEGDGSSPVDGVIDVNGTLYGATRAGGHCDDGTVYSLSATGRETVLHSFCYSSGGNASGGLIDVNGTLYGVTARGGSSNDGTVYRLSASGAYKVLYSFKGGTDGVTPVGTLLNVKGTLYGVTFNGGSSCHNSGGGCGTVYSVTTSGQETVLHRFSGSPDGALPEAGLIDVKGRLYGTTTAGGLATSTLCAGGGCGTVYSITTSGTENVLYRMSGGSHGASPEASLLEMNGTLYGTTSYGGLVTCGHGTYSLSCGTVFSMTTRGKNERDLHEFRGSDGATPDYLIDLNNVLYGTALRGGYVDTCGTNGCGTVFAFTP